MSIRVFGAVVAIICSCASALKPYANSQVLSEGYTLHWTVIQDSSSIELAVEAKTVGWVGFGLSPSGGMVGADIAIGLKSNGAIQIGDYMATAQQTPEKDAMQHWNTVSASRNSTHTVLEFSRSFETGDSKDHPFQVGPNRIIWAMGSSDTLGYHSQNRGQASVTFWGAIPTPPSDSENVDVLMASITVPADTTTYMCQGLELPKDKHAVFFQPIVENPDLVHHMLIYVCDRPVDKIPAPCDGMKAGCAGIMYAWAVGGGPLEFPADTGYVIPQHAVLEIHYNNPGGVTGVKDSSGVGIYVANTLRKHNVGLIEVGTPIPSINIPAGRNSFESTRQCDIPGTHKEGDQEFTVFASFVHMHEYGKQMYITLYRDGKYHDTLARNLNWDFNIQEIVMVDPNIPVRLGDSILSTCVWNTESTSTAVKGGDASSNEMCFGLLFYYPQAEVNKCDGVQLSKGDFNYSYPWDSTFTVRSPKKVSRATHVANHIARQTFIVVVLMVGLILLE